MNRRETEGKDTAEAPVIDRLAAALGRDLDPSLVASPGSISLVDGRCRELGIDRARFTELVARDRLEAARLRRQIVPPETWLFRYPASFEHLRREAASRSNSAPMRVASLGCATGAEPFSIAAALDGVVEFEIVALDRDASSLEIARSATLGLGSVRSEIPSWACGSLSVREHAVVMPAKWLDRIRFVEADLFDADLAPRLARFDAVFCRNVAIYFSSDARRRLGVLLTALLAPGGWLFLGHSETAATLGLDWRERAREAFAVRAAHGESAPERRSGGERSGTTPASFSASRRAPVTAGAPRAAARTGADPSIGADSRGRARPAPAPMSIDDIRRSADEGRCDEALSGAEAAYRRGERSAELLELLGTLSLIAGRRDDAARHLRASLYLDPTREAASIQLAMLTGDRRG